MPNSTLHLISATVLFLSLSGLVRGQQTASEPPREVLEARKVLQASADRFRTALDRIEEADWNFRPKGYRHTLGQEAEHAALAHQELQTMVVTALRRDEQPERAKALEGKEEMIRKRMLGSKTRAENYKVKNTLRSKAEVVEYFEAAHKKALNLLSVAPEPGTHIFKHPYSAAYGELTAIQWFYYIAYHCERHANIMHEMIEHPDFTGVSTGSA